MKQADAIDQLRATDPDEFIATRAALAKELKAAGDPAAAKALTAMRRPQLPVWALNQLSRLDDPALDDLFDSVDQLVAALDGDDGAPDVRESQRRYWEAVEATVAAVGQVVSDADKTLSPTAVDQTRATLQAATSDEDLGRALLEGRLDGLHTPSGFGGVVAVDRPSAPRKKKAPATVSSAPRSKANSKKEAAGEAEAAAAEHRRREREAERELARARRAHEKLVTRLVADAERRESEAAALADEADRRERLAAQARAQADAAASAAVEVRRRADRAIADPPG